MLNRLWNWLSFTSAYDRCHLMLHDLIERITHHVWIGDRLFDYDNVYTSLDPFERAYRSIHLKTQFHRAQDMHTWLLGSQAIPCRSIYLNDCVHFTVVPAVHNKSDVTHSYKSRETHKHKTTTTQSYFVTQYYWSLYGRTFICSLSLESSEIRTKEDFSYKKTATPKTGLEVC